MRRHVLVFALLIAAAGCSGRDEARDAGDPARSMVRVDVSYTHLAGAPLTEARFDAQAHFVRYRSFDPAGVPTILGFTDFDSIPLGTCRASDGTADLDSALSQDGLASGMPAEVSLLDAGPIEVRGPIDRAVLMPAHYPELVPFVSGVAYGADENSAVTLGLGQSYQVSGDGGEEVGPFVASVTAPRAFPILQLDPLHRGADLDVRWATVTPSAADDSAEPLLLAVKWATRTGSRAVRCRVADDGEVAVPASAFDTLPPPAALTSATVTAIRLTRGVLAAPGVGAGELTIQLRDVAPLQVAP